ncbi:MAG: MMPL family transporter [Bacteroidota bacterium]|nr:MMPL family transporter [Bacteroidota bacterium]
MWIIISRIILRFRLAILLMVVLSSAFMLYQAKNATLSYEMAKILPKNSVEFKNYENFKHHFGDNKNTMVIGVVNPDLFEYSQYSGWLNLSNEINAISGVDKTTCIDDLSLLVKDSINKSFIIIPWYNKEDQSQDAFNKSITKLMTQPFYKDLFYNEQSKASLMLVSINREILKTKGREKLIHLIHQKGEAYAKAQNLELHYSGLPYIRTVNSVQIRKEITLFIILTLLITAFILYLFFRSVRATLASIFVVIIGVIWSFGSMSVLGFEISIIMALVPPLIVVIGIPNCIFLLNKFHNEYKVHKNKIKAISRIINKVGNITLLTNLSTASGFAAFALTKSQTLKEFGIIASMNIMLIFLFSLILIPIALSYFNSPKRKHTQHLDKKWVKNVVNTLIHLVQFKRAQIYVVTLLVVVLGILGIFKIKTTGNLTDDLPKSGALYKDINFFEKHFSGVMPAEILIDTKKKNGVMKLSVLKKIAALQSELDSFPEFSRTVSVVDFAKYCKQSFYNGDSNFYKLPNTQEKDWILSYAKKMQNENKLIEIVFSDSLNQIARISMWMADISTPKIDSVMEVLQPKIDKIFDSEKYDVSLTGSSIVFLNGTKYLVRNLFTSLFLVIVLISIFMAWIFNSFRMVVVSLIPNLIPLLLTAAIMGYFGIAIKPSTILVFSIAFGISVDDTIHFLAKYRQELIAKKWNIKRSVIAALKETGVSMIYTSIVLFCGFFIFIASEFGGTVALGLLVSITLLIAMLANLLLLPALLLSLEQLITTEAFKEPLLDIFDEEEDVELKRIKVKRKT